MPSSSALVQCQSLSVRFGSFSALADFDLTLLPGQAVALIGPNGAGKSTALKVIAGLEAESSGSLSVLGERPKSASPSWKRRLGVLPEHLSLFDALTIEEHFHLSAELYGLNRSESHRRTEDLLALLGLANSRDRFAASSSYGMRKKTALGLALLHAPSLLLLDEPFEGLDPASCEVVLALLLLLRSRGVGILISSHMLFHVERLAHEVLLLDHGRVAWRGEPHSQLELHSHYLATIAPAPLPALDWVR